MLFSYRKTRIKNINPKGNVDKTLVYFTIPQNYSVDPKRAEKMSAHTQIVGTHKISQVKQKVNSSISHDHKC